MARDCPRLNSHQQRRTQARPSPRRHGGRVFFMHRRTQGGDRAARQLQRRGALQGRVYGRAAAGRDLPRRHPRRGQLCRVQPGRRGLHRRDDRVGRVWQRARPGDRAAGRRVTEHGDARVTPLCLCNRMPRPAGLPRSHPLLPCYFVCGGDTQGRECGSQMRRYLLITSWPAAQRIANSLMLERLQAGGLRYTTLKSLGFGDGRDGRPRDRVRACRLVSFMLYRDMIK